MSAKEEAKKAVKKRIEKLKKEHDQAVVDAREEGYDEAISGAADEVAELKNTICKARYGFSMDSIGLLDDHDLYMRVVVWPPGAFTLQPISNNDAETSSQQQT